MLQRFVKSTMRYVPRPRLMLFAPWLCISPSPAHSKSLPKARLSILRKNAGWLESTSSNGPCLSHAFRMRMRPASSMISASIIPGLSLKSPMLFSPLITASTASLLQSGHNEGTFRGTPVVIGILSQLLSSWRGAQVGRGNSLFGTIALRVFEMSHAPFDTERNTRAATADIVLNLQREIWYEGEMASILQQLRTPREDEEAR